MCRDTALDGITSATLEFAFLDPEYVLHNEVCQSFIEMTNSEVRFAEIKLRSRCARWVELSGCISTGELDGEHSWVDFDPKLQFIHRSAAAYLYQEQPWKSGGTSFERQSTLNSIHDARFCRVWPKRREGQRVAAGARRLRTTLGRANTAANPSHWPLL